MPNKYSYAQVLSNYESYGVIDRNGPRLSQRSRPVTLKTRLTARNGTAVITRLQASESSGGSLASRRIRVDSPSPSPSPPPSRSDGSPVHSASSSLETQIYIPTNVPITPPIKPGPVTPAATRSKSRSKSAKFPHAAPCLSCGHHPETNRHRIEDFPTEEPLSCDDRVTVSLEGHGAHGLPSFRRLRNTPRRLSKETAIFAPEHPAESLSTPAKTANFPTHEFIIERPPSPPLTPQKSTASSPTTDAAPPWVKPSDLDRPTWENTLPVSAPQTEASGSYAPSHTKSTTGVSSRRSSLAFSITTRTSSLKAPPAPSTTDPSLISVPPGISDLPRGKTSLDADLESLPSEVHSDEFNISPAPEHPLPDPTRDGFFWTAQSQPVGSLVKESDLSPRPPTRETSFDSAAPPPIGRNPHAPHATNQSSKKRLLPLLFFRRGRNPEPRPNAEPNIPKQNVKQGAKLTKPSDMQKKQGPTRLTSVAHSSTAPHTPPAEVDMSGPTALGSISKPFPNHRNQWPPVSRSIVSVNIYSDADPGKTSMPPLSTRGRGSTWKRVTRSLSRSGSKARRQEKTRDSAACVVPPPQTNGVERVVDLEGNGELANGRDAGAVTDDVEMRYRSLERGEPGQERTRSRDSSLKRRSWFDDQRWG